MRKISLSALTLALFVLGTTAAVETQAQAPAATAGHRIAVVDVAKIFKNHAGIKAQVAAIEGNLKSIDAELKGKQNELKTEAGKLKSFAVGSPDYTAQEEKVASLESKLRLEMGRKRKELQDAEARIYFDNYQLISKGVAFLANHYKLNLVLRYNSEEMELAKGESVLRGVMKNIVYHDPSLDMTQAVMQYLDTEIAKTGGNARR